MSDCVLEWRSVDVHHVREHVVVRPCSAILDRHVVGEGGGGQKGELVRSRRQHGRFTQSAPDNRRRWPWRRRQVRLQGACVCGRRKPFTPVLSDRKRCTVPACVAVGARGVRVRQQLHHAISMEAFPATTTGRLRQAHPRMRHVLIPSILGGAKHSTAVGRRRCRRRDDHGQVLGTNCRCDHVLLRCPFEGVDQEKNLCFPHRRH